MLTVVLGFAVAVVLLRFGWYLMEKSNAAKLEEAARPGLAEAMRERTAKTPVTRDEQERPDGKYAVTFRVAFVEAELAQAAADSLKRDIAAWCNLRGLEAGEADVVVTCPEPLFPDFESAYTDTVLAAPRIQELQRFGCDLRLRRDG